MEWSREGRGKEIEGKRRRMGRGKHGTTNLALDGASKDEDAHGGHVGSSLVCAWQKPPGFRVV